MTAEVPRLHHADINRDKINLVESLPNKQLVNPALIEVNRLKYRLPPRNPEVVYGDPAKDHQSETSHLFDSESKLITELISECNSYMPKDSEGNSQDLSKINPAISLALYGHQRQFRFSGEPWMVHPIKIALEAARVYRADWQTIALCLTHDLFEDSPKFGHQVRKEHVIAAYRSIGLEDDGKLLARMMGSMEKTATTTLLERFSRFGLTELFNRQKKLDELGTISKLYDTLLKIEGADFGDERVILVKLLDRLHNMRTIRYQDEIRQQELAYQTLHIYVPMADAFKLFRIRDELAEISIGLLYPDEAKNIQETRETIARYLEDANQDEELMQNIKAAKNIFKPIPEWLANDDVPQIQESVPGAYELFKQRRTRRDPNYSFLKLALILPDLREENDQSFNYRSSAIIQMLTDASDRIEHDLPVSQTFLETKVSPGRFHHLEAVNKNYRYHVEIKSRDQDIRDTTTIAYLFSGDSGAIDEMHGTRVRYAVTNLADLRRGYMDARLRGDLSAFFETIAGELVILDENGHLRRFDETATALDALLTIYKKEGKRVKELHLQRGNDIFILLPETLGMRLQPGDNLVRLEKRARSQGDAIKADWLDFVTVDSLREDIVKPKLKEKSEKNQAVRNSIISRGERIVQTLFNQAWVEYLQERERKPSTQSPETLLTIPLENIRPFFQDRYPSEKIVDSIEDLLFDVGLNQPKEELIQDEWVENLINELIKFRQGVIYLEIPILHIPGASDRVLKICAGFGINLLTELGQAKMITGGVKRLWFHESDLGRDQSNEFRNLKLQELIKKLKEVSDVQRDIILEWLNKPKKRR